MVLNTIKAIVAREKRVAYRAIVRIVALLPKERMLKARMLGARTLRLCIVVSAKSWHLLCDLHVQEDGKEQERVPISGENENRKM